MTPFSAVPFILIAVAMAGCAADATRSEHADDVAAVSVVAATAVEAPIARFIRVSGTLTAEAQAEVAAEVAGRVVATPVERGTAVAAGAILIVVAADEAEAQAREAQANAAQIEARLGIASGAPFDIERVPEVANARAAQDLARTELSRARQLLEAQLLAQAEFDQRSAQFVASERQYEMARNNAAQQYQSLRAARARVTVAEKAVADTTVRSPFAGMVGQRLVSLGDYVTRGTKVASVVRIDALRVELTVPEQYVSTVQEGRAVTFTVDAYPGETFTGQVRYVSPSVTAETRALTIEAVVPNPDRRLKPGFFATARIEQAALPGILVPSSAVRTTSGTARVFIINGDRAEERIVVAGQQVGERIEITSGVSAGERLAASNVEQLIDGVRVAPR